MYCLSAFSTLPAELRECLKDTISQESWHLIYLLLRDDEYDFKQKQNFLNSQEKAGGRGRATPLPKFNQRIYKSS